MPLILNQVDAFSVILSIIISIVSLLAFRDNRSRMPLYIGIGFAIFGFSYLLALFDTSLEMDYLVLLVRMFAFVTVLFAVYTSLGEVRTQVTLLSEKNIRLEREIIERANAEKELRIREAQLNAVILGSPLPQFVIDKNHRVIYWNDALAEYSGIHSETVVGTNQQWKAFSDRECPSMADLLIDGLVESTSQYKTGLWGRSPLTKNGFVSRVPIRKRGESESWVHFTAAPIHDGSGTILGAIETLEDITERIQKDERISKLSMLKERLLGAYRLDVRLKIITDGIVEIFNADFSRIWILEKSDLCEKGCVHASVNEGPHICRDRSRCLHLIASSGRYTHINGGHRRVPVGAYKIGRVASGEYPGFVTNDVTHDPRVHDHDWARSLGFISFAGYQLSSEDNQPIGVLALFSKHVLKPWEADLLKDLAHTASLIIIRDTASKAIRESEVKFRSLTENTPDIVFSTDLNGTITYVSPKINEIGFLVEEIVGRTLFSLAHPDDQKRIVDEFTSQLHERARFDTTFRIPDKWEITHYFDERSDLILDEYGNPVEIDGLLKDITERKNAEDKIQRSLQEKEVLLKEIHHRVKNNLQVVWGLIDLQIQTIRDQNMINTLRDSQNRVRTMSLIHETLYRSDDLSHIRILQYLQNLMNTLLSTYSISPDRIRVELDIDDVLLDVESAIPCGLIVNELMSNAFKHAFPDGRTGQIYIGFHLNEGVYTLSFADDGVGIPLGIDYLNTDSLGLKLVNLLATDQLDGTIQLNREGGTTFIITFPKKIQ